MSSEPYLICHLVRGAPAFDIAEQLEGSGTESDPGPWWIIPTSGHRAYPYWHHTLYDLFTGDLKGNVIHNLDNSPEGWPDHYSTSAAPKGQGLVRNLASLLGLVPKGTIRRR